jgi:hypothetical protein
MSKMFVFTIGGYNNFAVPMEDGPHALMIMSRMVPVAKTHWNDQFYTVKGDGEPPVSSMNIADVREPVPPAPAPEPTPEAAPAPLAIGHTPKLLAPEDEEQPF